MINKKAQIEIIVVVIILTIILMSIFFYLDYQDRMGCEGLGGEYDLGRQECYFLEEGKWVQRDITELNGEYEIIYRE